MLAATSTASRPMARTAASISRRAPDPGAPGAWQAKLLVLEYAKNCRGRRFPSPAAPWRQGLQRWDPQVRRPLRPPPHGSTSASGFFKTAAQAAPRRSSRHGMRHRHQLKTTEAFFRKFKAADPSHPDRCHLQHGLARRADPHDRLAPASTGCPGRREVGRRSPSCRTRAATSLEEVKCRRHLEGGFRYDGTLPKPLRL